jgi:hypothetical protein
MATTIEIGVAAYLHGQFWGCQRPGGGHGEGDVMGYGPIENAKLNDPCYCLKPTDMTYTGSDYERKLAPARLVMVRKTTTFEVIG